MGKRRLGYVIRLKSSVLGVPFRIIQRTSKFTRKLVESSSGGGAYAFSEMMGHMSMLRDFYPHFMYLAPGMVSREDCESLGAHLKDKEISAEKFSVQHLLAIKQAEEKQESDNVYLAPGSRKPADGLTETKTDLAPLLRPLESGANNPGTLRPLTRVASCES